MRYLLIACLVMFSAACVLDQDELGQSADELTVMTTDGEWITADPAKICWDTVGPPPKGFVAVPDPDNHRFKYVADGSARTFEGTQDEQAVGMARALEFADEGGGGCTCSCAGGNCDPVLWKDGGCGCMIREGCSNCKKTN